MEKPSKTGIFLINPTKISYLIPKTTDTKSSYWPSDTFSSPRRALLTGHDACFENFYPIYPQDPGKYNLGGSCFSEKKARDFPEPFLVKLVSVILSIFPADLGNLNHFFPRGVIFIGFAFCFKYDDVPRGDYLSVLYPGLRDS